MLVVLNSFNRSENAGVCIVFGDSKSDSVIQNIAYFCSERRFSEHVKEAEMFSAKRPQDDEPLQRILPTLALNDVFVGESLSAR